MLIKVSLIFLFASTVAFGQGSDKALRFDGNDLIRFGNELLPVDGSAWSLATWVKPTVVNNGIHNVVFAQYTVGGNGRIHFFEKDSSWVYFFGHSSGDVRLEVAPADINEWQHLAFVCDGSQVSCYKNGILMGSAAISGNVELVESTVGSDSQPLIFDRYFDGDIDEMNIWNRALTHQEIRHKMTERLTGTEPGLVACYRMNEGADNSCAGGQDVCDTSGNGNHGTKF